MLAEVCAVPVEESRVYMEIATNVEDSEWTTPAGRTQPFGLEDKEQHTEEGRGIYLLPTLAAVEIAPSEPRRRRRNCSRK